MAIPMMGYILAMAFPIYMNTFNKDVIDGHRNTELNVTVPVEKDIALEEGSNGKPTAAIVGATEDTTHNA
jgi:FHS family L-fucose permease-like MFS transporter